MKRYTDINKTRNIFHNAAVIRGPITPRNNNNDNNQKTYPYPHIPPDNSTIKFYLSILIIIFLASLYIYSEAKHNEKSVFYAMRNIINLYYQQNSISQNNKNIQSLSPFLIGQKTQTINKNFTPSQTTVHNIAPQINVETQKNNNPPTPLPLAPMAQTNLSTIKQKQKQENLNEKLYQEDKNIFLYLPIINKNKDQITFYPLTKKIENTKKQLEYGNAIKYLIEEQVNKKDTFNFFEKRVKVKKAWVENDTLIIDLNRAFEYSPHGHFGLLVRIQQVLWTVFNLPTNLYDSKGKKNITPIAYVSFLIDGRRKSKIGGDGMVLNPFYSKEDLKSSINIKL